MNESCAVVRKEAPENKPQQPKEHGRGAQRSIHLGNWQWNLKTKEYRWCDEMHRIFQITPQQYPLRTGTFLNRVHPEDREKVVKAIGQALVGAQPYNIEHRILWPDGSIRFVHGKAETIFDRAGRPLGLMGTVQDITDSR